MRQDLRSSSPGLGFVVDRRVASVCSYWCSLLDGARPPERRRLDPARMLRALPYLWIAEREEDDPPRFCLRLSGEEVNRLFGESIRHHYISEIFPSPIAEEVDNKLERVVATPAIVWTLGPFFETSPDGPKGECVVMPLMVEGRCRAVLGVTVPTASIVRPPRRLYPICRQKEIVPLEDFAQAA
jgi:hypothetical protein